MQLARVAAMLLLISFMQSPYIIVILALVLSYIEIYPMRALRFIGGENTLERDNDNRSRD
jgi:hypothetical protein